MAPSIQEAVDYIFAIAPNDPGAYENLYQTGSGEGALRAIGVAWWIDSVILADFAARGVNFGISHESVFYELPATCRWGLLSPADELLANQKIASLAERHEMVIHRFHSNIDFAPWGMPRALIDQLGWTDHQVDWSRGVPVVTLPTTTLEGLIRHIRAKLGLPFVRYDGDPGRALSRSGSSLPGKFHALERLPRRIGLQGISKPGGRESRHSAAGKTPG